MSVYCILYIVLYGVQCMEKDGVAPLDNIIAVVWFSIVLESQSMSVKWKFIEEYIALDN